MEPKVSVVIPVHNRIELTRRCLYRWLRQEHCPPYEVLVVDDASKQNVQGHLTVRALGPYQEWGKGPKRTIRFLRLEHDLLARSPNTAYRAGMAQAESDFLVLSSQDVLVPRLALRGLLDTAERFPERRASMTVYWMTERMMGFLEEQPWQTDLLSVTRIPGFWTEPTPYARPNQDIHGGGMFVLCTGQSRGNWEWIGGLRDTPYFGMDDRDLFTREQFLDRRPVTVPEMYCIHQWHPKRMHLRSLLAHPGFDYQTEAQARLLDEARPMGHVTPLGQLKAAMADEVIADLKAQDIARQAQQHNVPTPSTVPDHVTRLLLHVLDLLTRYGVHSLALANDWYGRHFIQLAAQRYGWEAWLMADDPQRDADVVLSLMYLQEQPTFARAWAIRDALRHKGRQLLVLVPYREHFYVEGCLQFDEAALQAPCCDMTMTGYLIGIW